MRRDKFDRLFDRGRDAVLSGQHYRDTPPVDGGRWGISVIFRPGGELADRLDALTAEALDVAGGIHWPTGARTTLHMTVRALEAHRLAVPDEDVAVGRYGAALRRAAASGRSVRLGFAGLTLTPSGVMACAYPADDAADSFAAVLADELGRDGGFEADFTRDIWYATLIHFTGPLPDPSALVAWVAARRDIDLGSTHVQEVELVRWQHSGSQPMRVPLLAVPLGKGGAAAAVDRPDFALSSPRVSPSANG
ncbi:hypothetical protein QLQ12_29830 [Actinoplanes sp. NEAU-A12]|uniref:2'-5' RNA ligase family protein n=1 Tax=Actinoplanes sandaracinus TaxID=3045177 RepID=A0ABT6WSY9_9ACTN|nr:hypothetical protein [Actinoplanes sandaracinus]MDI6102825.1 hypothetical protein [Actinoplanes sandaracinus]